MSVDAAPPEITVRPAVRADAATIAVFNLRMAHETENLRFNPTTLERGVHAVFDDPRRGTYHVAEARGAVVGCLLVTHEWSDWRDGDVWWLQSVYVHVEHRRGGVFRAMFDHVERAAREAGVVAIRLYVERSNAAAVETYRRCGLDPSHYELMHKSL